MLRDLSLLARSNKFVSRQSCDKCSCLEKMEAREVSFVEAQVAARRFLAALLEDDEAWSEAAHVRSGKAFSCF